jgi:hypothetical protein
MAAPKIFFVQLRRPGRNDSRKDPFYEFGSFGCTKCHSRTLFNPKNREKLQGARLAFVQGGPLGSRLVFLTPTIKVTVWKDCCEARWTPKKMPFKYTEAPILVRNDGYSDFSLVKQFALHSRSSTRKRAPRSLGQRFSSKVRSLSSHVETEMAKQLVSVYERQRKGKSRSAIASTYDQALPKVTQTDLDRKKTYRHLIRKRKAETDGAESAMLVEMTTPETQARPSCDSKRRTRPCS